MLKQFKRHLLASSELLAALRELRGAYLLCHCPLSEKCHGDIIVEVFRQRFVDCTDEQVLDPGKLSASNQYRQVEGTIRLAPTEPQAAGGGDGLYDDGLPARISDYYAVQPKSDGSLPAKISEPDAAELKKPVVLISRPPGEGGAARMARTLGRLKPFVD